jgi:hypothetical protein
VRWWGVAAAPLQVCRGGSSCNGHDASKSRGGDVKTAGARALSGDKSKAADGQTSGGEGKEGAGGGKRVRGFLFLRELFEMAKSLQMGNQVCVRVCVCACFF